MWPARTTRATSANPQLQRIYGTGVQEQDRDGRVFHRCSKRRSAATIARSARRWGLFALDTEYVGPGLPLWLPKGTAIVEELEKLAKETEFAAGYVRVKTPHIAKEKMYLTSGHLPILYAESMFPPMEIYEDRDKAKELTNRIIANNEQVVACVRPLGIAAGISDDPQTLGNYAELLVQRGEAPADLDKLVKEHSKLFEGSAKISPARTLLFESHELPASPPHFCG